MWTYVDLEPSAFLIRPIEHLIRGQVAIPSTLPWRRSPQIETKISIFLHFIDLLVYFIEFVSIYMSGSSVDFSRKLEGGEIDPQHAMLSFLIPFLLSSPPFQVFSGDFKDLKCSSVLCIPNQS